MTPDLPIPGEAVEAMCDLTYLGKQITENHARHLLAAALPHLRSLQVETQPIAMFNFDSLANDGETKRLIETATQLGRALGRKEAAEEIAEALEAVNPHASTLACAAIARDHALQPQNATSEPRTDLPVGPSHPDDPGSRRKRYPHAHVCVTCSPDGLHQGPGCINCRGTGWDQTPCQAEGHKPQCPHGCCDPLAPSHPQDSQTAREAL